MLDVMVIAAVQLVVLHRSDGGEVTVSARQVTSLRSTEGMTHVAPEGHCLIGLTDGKYVVVRERCENVKHQLEGMK